MKSFGITLACLLFVSPAPATDMLAHVLGEMETQNKNIKNIQFDFRQEIKFFNTENVTEVTGSAVFQKPGQMRIQKKKPEDQLVVSNGKKMWVYTPAYKQVWTGPSANWMGASFFPKGLVPMDNFVRELKSNFSLKSKNGDQAGRSDFWILAEPKDSELGYRMELLISTSTWLPVKTVFQSDTARIVTELLNTKINLDIPSQSFRFLAPKGTEVIPL